MTLSKKNIQIKTTPNPACIQFIFPQELTNKTFEFKNQNEASSSPLSKTILGFPWVKQVFISQNFIAITKEDWVEWETLKTPLLELILEYIDSQQPIIITQNETPSENNTDSEIIKKIKHIIDTEIQPAVQMDGGFIRFSKYSQGKVYLQMQGACSGCPSAEWTLKQGIETRIKQDIPQVIEVISV